MNVGVYLKSGLIILPLATILPDVGDNFVYSSFATLPSSVWFHDGVIMLE